MFDPAPNLQSFEKNSSLEGLRGIACLSVFLCHFLFSLFPAVTQGLAVDTVIPPKYAWETIASMPMFTVFYGGNFGVAIFFVISGFVLTNRFFKTNDVRYLQRGAAKRYIRLGLPVFASIMIAWFLLTFDLMFTQQAPEIGSAGWPMEFYRDPVSFVAAVKDGAYGASLFGSDMLNKPLWTIQVEILGSMILFATYAMCGTRQPVFNFGFFVVALLIIFPESVIQLHCLTIYAGSLLNYVRWQEIRSAAVSVGLALTGVVLGAYDYSAWFSFLRMVPLPTMASPIVDLSQLDRYVYNAIGAICLVSAVLSSPRLAKGLSKPIFVWLGRMSFSLYLLHWPLICSLSFGSMYFLVRQSGFEYGLAALTTFGVTFVVALGASWIFERYIDVPSQILASRFARLVLDDRPASCQTAQHRNGQASHISSPRTVVSQIKDPQIDD